MHEAVPHDSWKGRCLWLGRSCDEGCNTDSHQGHVVLPFWGRFLQAGKPPPPPPPCGAAAGACVPGTAARQIRGEVDWLCLENRVVHWESWQCCKFPRGRSNTEGARGGNHLYRFHTVQVRLWVHRRKLWEHCPSLHWPVSLHALGWQTLIKTSFAQFNV